jgi:hypothetical protein
MNSGDQAKCDSYTTSGNSTGNATSSYNVTDWDNDDFTLTESATLMIDQGREANAPALDYIDTPRPQGSADDIGAYEYQQSANPIDGMLIQ